MKKTIVLSAVALSSALALNEVQAADMEKCEIVVNGQGLIKEKKADCKGIGHSCAGQNKEGDPISYILVPKGMCAKIRAGQIEGVPQNILDKINVEKLPRRK